MLHEIAGLAVAHTARELRAQVLAWRHLGLRVALVPTMGALHEGHLSLIDAALARADRVVVSIFVNPKQFGPGEDLDRYPRTLTQDCGLCRGRGAHLCYAPSAAEMYPQGYQTSVRVGALTEPLCGASRPHFFEGVTTVVAKLLNAAMADVAIFGEKDYQQLQVVARMVRDLDHPTTIIGVPTVRESDGLALSSRNTYLSPQERLAARAIHAGICHAQSDVSSARAPLAAAEIEDRVRGGIAAAGGRVDYVAVVDPDTLVPLPVVDRPARLLIAAFFGPTRLIDNAPLAPQSRA